MKFGLFLFLVSIILVPTVWSQPGGGERPKIGTLTGNVKSASNKEPVAYAKVYLLNVKDSSVVTGGLADSTGHFLIEEIQVGPYIAKINSFGFESYFIDSLFFSPRAPKIDLGLIYMSQNDTLLDGVDIVVERNDITAQIDKKVFNMDKQLTSQGGTALDALQNVPSVTIDVDGNISLRGNANVTILIDGRPSTITGSGRQGALSSIPASSIESIEIITNPSAKYDPDGMSGIINIVLKKNKMKGFNGSIDLSIENGLHPDSLDTYSQFLGFNYNASFNLAYRNKYFNLYGTYSANWYEGYRNFFQTNETFYNGIYDELRQERTGTHLRQGQLVKIGTDFYINPKNTIGFSVNGNLGNEDRTGNQYYYASDSVTRYDVWQRLSNDPGNRFGLDANLFYAKKFDVPEHKLDFNTQYSRGQSAEEGFYIENNYDPVNMNLLIPGSLDQFVSTIDGNAITTIQLDYYKPLMFTKLLQDSTEQKNPAKIETGAKTTIRQVSQDYYQETFNIADTALNNNFDFTEQVHAAYAIFGQEFKPNNKAFASFKYQIGLRGEMVFITSKVDKDPIVYKNNYYSLYPSVHIVKPLSITKEISLSYSRRVNRPGLHSLNPFSKYSDPLNLQVGNPELNPEYINSMELGFATYGKKLTLTSSLYYRYMTDMIQRVKDVDSNGVSTITWSNVDEGHFYGLEIMTIYKPVKWWRIMLSFNFSQTFINSSSGESALNNSGYSWSSNMTQTFTFTKGWTSQLTGFYRSPMILTQGRSQPMYSLDIAIKKTFLKDKMYVNFKIADMFNTRQFGYSTFQEGVFTSTGIWKHQSRRFMVTIGYVFGNQDPDRKRRDSRIDSGGGDMGG